MVLLHAAFLHFNQSLATLLVPSHATVGVAQQFAWLRIMFFVDTFLLMQVFLFSLTSVGKVDK